MRQIFLLLSLFVLAAPAARSQTATLRYNPPASSACSGTQNCSVSLTGKPIISGDTLIYQCEANHGAITTVGDTGIFQVMKPLASIHSGYQGSQGVIFSATAETGSDLITFTYQNGNASASTSYCTIWEYQVTGGTLKLDGDNGITGLSGTTLTLPTFMPSGTGDISLLQSFAPFTAATSISSPFSLFTNSFSSLAHAENLASPFTPLWTWPSGQANLMAQQVQLGFNSLPCVDETLGNFGGTNGGGGVNGTNVTQASLAANTLGFQGGTWIFNGTGAFQYSTAASSPLVGNLGRACDGTTPSASGTTGITYPTSIGNNVNWQFGGSSNGGILTTGTLTADINISSTIPNGDASFIDTFVTETNADNDFTNAKLTSIGGLRGVVLECGGHSADLGGVVMTPGQTYHFQEIITPGGQKYFNVYSGWQNPFVPGVLIGSTGCPSLGATFYPQVVAFGNGQVANVPTPGFNVNFDSFMLTFGPNNTCYAASLAPADVLAAANLCRPIANSTVVLPTGAATWTSQVAVALLHSMTLQGQSLCTGGCAPGSKGIGLTFADNGSQNTTGGACTPTVGTCITLDLVGQPALTFSGCNATTILRITQITFINIAGNSGGSVQPNCQNGTNGGYRFDHLDVINSNGVFMEADGGTGLNDHILYTGIGATPTCHPGPCGYSYSVFGGDFSTVGYSNWAAASPWGSANANFIEDSASFQMTTGGAITDGHFGCNIVIRYSQITGWDGAGITHGTDSGGYRSCIIAEVYSNTMNTNATGANVNPWGSRGGSVLFHDNVLGGSFRWGAIAIDYFRANPADAGNSEGYGLAGPGLNWTQTALNVGGTTLNAPAYQTNHTYAALSVVTLPAPCGVINAPSNVQTVAGGTTGPSIPACPAFASNVTDSGGVIWTNVGGAITASPGGLTCGPSSNQQCAGFLTTNPDTQCFAGTACLRYFDANGGVWPFRDQPCVGHDQISQGCYQWNNSGSQQPENYWFTDSSGAVQLNRDYFNAQPSGYTPYTYPHPLDGGAGCTNGPTTISPPSENFGSVTVGQPSSGMVSTVTNGNCSAITISTINYTGTNNLDFSTSSTTCSGTVPAGGSCTITTVFTPGAAGARAATLNFNYTGPASGDLMVSLSGIGGAPQVASCVETQTTTPNVTTNVGRNVKETEINTTVATVRTGSVPSMICRAIP